jgi:hypothetical protein
VFPRNYMHHYSRNIVSIRAVAKGLFNGTVSKPVESKELMQDSKHGHFDCACDVLNVLHQILRYRDVAHIPL